MKKVFSFSTSLSFFASLILLTSIVFAALFGVYFLGDTITHLQFGLQGGPVTTFIQHDPLWPPLFALVLNLLHKLPLDPYLLASLFVSAVAVTYVVATATFAKQLGFTWKVATTFAGLTLVGPITIIIQSHISEPLFILLWVVALLATTQFVRTAQEKWLIIWLLPTALLPLTRYIGIVVVGWFSLVLILKLAYDLYLKKKQQYSRWLLVICLGIVWLPLAFYLFRTKIQIGMPFAARDINTQFTAVQIATRYLATIVQDIGVVAVVSLLLGVSLQKGKKIKHLGLPLAVTFGSATSYLLGLFLSEHNYFVLPYIPSRYLGVSYPFIILSCLFVGYSIGQYLHQKYRLKTKALHTNLVCIAVTCLLLFAAYSNISRLNLERQTQDSVLSEVLWTGDVQKLCDTSHKQKVIIHLHSRNWAAKSYPYLCSGATVAPEEILSVEPGTKIISAYKIDNQNLEHYHQLQINSFTTYFYQVLQPTEIDIPQVFANRTRFE